MFYKCGRVYWFPSGLQVVHRRIPFRFCAPVATYHRIPVAVKMCDGTYRGEWFEHTVGLGIKSRWQAIVAVIYYKFTGSIWWGAFR